MDSYNSSANFSLGADDSQLLDVMEVLPSDSSTSRPDDLSLADLSLDQTVRLGLPAPFSLLSRPQEAPSRQREEQQQQEQRQKGKATASSKLIDPENNPDATRRWEGGGDEPSAHHDHGEGGEEEGSGDDELAQEASEEARRRTEKIREDKLQSDIFILKKLNAAFEQFNGALDEAGAANHVRTPSTFNCNATVGADCRRELQSNWSRQICCLTSTFGYYPRAKILLG
jgi:hypothetical protein